jgi:hypothetical protein
MYRKKDPRQLEFENFYLPFGGKLRSDNRWVLLAEKIPWGLAESFYAEQFDSNGLGSPAKSARVALGALIIKERLGVSDEEAVEQIRENPYLQYFLGFHEYRDEAPFHPSMYVHFRKRFSLEQLGQINEAISQSEDVGKKKDPPDDPDSPSGGNQGKLIVDATCAPADIRYPTDISLVNEARVKSEAIIDVLFAPLRGTRKKPRTYRRKARKLYVSYSKKRKHSSAQRRKALRKQLGFLRRNLKTIERLSSEVSLSVLDRQSYKMLLVIHEVYRQQKWMYDHKSRRIDDRIVSISQPHVRPIVRGKASAATEFGAKLSVSLVNGFVYLDTLCWDAYNESVDLKAQVESYRRRFGFYPASVHCDRIYRTRDNRAYCKEHGIRMSGPALGRPPKETEKNKDRKLQQRQDELDRIPIEGKFGQGKRRFGLGRIMAKLSQTSETVIALIFIVMNLEKCLKTAFLFFFALQYPLRRPIRSFCKAMVEYFEAIVTEARGICLVREPAPYAKNGELHFFQETLNNNHPGQPEQQR